MELKRLSEAELREAEKNMLRAQSEIAEAFAMDLNKKVNAMLAEAQRKMELLSGELVEQSAKRHSEVCARLTKKERQLIFLKGMLTGAFVFAVTSAVSISLYFGVF